MTETQRAAGDVDQPQPQPEAEALLRVFLAGYVSGYASAYVSAGVPEPAVRTAALGVARAIYADPITRNAVADDAIAAFRGEPMAGGRINVDICGCGVDHHHPADENGSQQ